MSAEVAVITRTRNRASFLRRALASVAAQTFTNWRLYVVNDGAAAGPVDEAIKSVDADAQKRIEVLHLRQRVGMEAATNAALARLTERYVVLLDDDDSWSPEFLSSTVAALGKRSSPTVRGVVVRTEVVEERLDGDQVVELARKLLNGDLDALSLQRLARGNQFTNNAFVFEREALATVGGFNEDLRVFGDWDFNLRFLQSFDIDVVPRALARYHRRVEAKGEHRNSFEQEVGLPARGRAHLVNLWLRGSGGRSPHVGTLMALGPFIDEQTALRERVDKYLNAFHRIRRLPLVRSLDGALFGIRR
jgi:glycosyltransferase involved in cell wall biosynthesis